ncbi:hypothetical protein V8F33_013262 [Rhypophila sp. PSN 637]
MDPLSMAAGIGSLCGLTVKLIFAVSEFIDQVQQAPKEVQALNTELASLYAGLGHIKMAIQAPRISQIPPTWEADFNSLADDCDKTLKEVELIINKAKRTETTGSARQMLKTVRFVFKASQVEFLRRRIVSQNGILQILLAALTESRGGHIEQRLEDIHTKVEELLSSRQNIKQVLVVLEREDDDQPADYVLSDRTSRNVPQQISDTVEPQQDRWAQIRQNAGERAARAQERQAATGAGSGAGKPPDGEETSTGYSQAGGSSSPPVPDWTSAAMNWINSPPGREAVSGAWAQAFQGIGQQMMAANSSDIAERVFEATRPSADVLKAIEMIDSGKIWPLMQLRRRTSKTDEWHEVSPQAYGVQRLSLCLGLEETKMVVLACHLLQFDGNLSEHQHDCGTGPCSFWVDGTLHLEGKTVREDYDEHYLPNGEDVLQEFTFENSQDAKDFHFCVSQIVSHTRRARKINTIVLKNIRGGESPVYDSSALEKETRRMTIEGIKQVVQISCVVM